jgi:hypothetical protein
MKRKNRRLRVPLDDFELGLACDALEAGVANLRVCNANPEVAEAFNKLRYKLIQYQSKLKETGDG